MRKMNRALAALVAVGVFAAGAMLTRTACAATAKPADVKKMEAALPDKAPAAPAKARKVLVYGLAQGFVHSSIPLGEQTIAKLGEKTGAWTATISEDPTLFDADKLNEFDAVVLVSTTGNFLIPRMEVPGDPKKMNDEQKAAYEAKKKEAEIALKPFKDAEKQRMNNLLTFVRGGKGLAGIHAATDAYYSNREYGDVIGGFFNGHPWNEKVVVKIDDPNSPLTAMFDKGQDLVIADEIYQFTSKGKDKNGQENQPYTRKNLHVLLSLNMAEGKTPRKGVNPENDFGVAWIREAGQGRVFYCSLGHREEIYWNPTILKFYLSGIQYALGDLKADAAPSEK
jgi:type 1 glutamine amidotransferase